MQSELSEIYYSTDGYWKGYSAIKKLASVAKVRTVNKPNKIHQADLLFLPHDKVGRRTFRYALT